VVTPVKTGVQSFSAPSGLEGPPKIEASSTKLKNQCSDAILR